MAQRLSLLVAFLLAALVWKAPSARLPRLRLSASNAGISTYAHNPNAGLDEYAFNIGLGGAFGGLNPIGAGASLSWGTIGAGVGAATNGDWRTGYLAGDLAGSIVGAGIDDAKRFAMKTGAARQLAAHSSEAYRANFARHVAKYVGVQGIGAGVGGYVGYQQTGTAQGALFYANLGAMGGGIFAAKFVPCFAAGTLVLTPDGLKPIESLRKGDLVLSRDEFNVHGPVEPRLVEQVFERVGVIFHLRVAGQVIRTTPEHPFYVQGKGWTSAGELAIGDLLATNDERWAAIEDLLIGEVEEKVFNLRVAEFHTYFVGSLEWKFSVWAHNAYHPKSSLATREVGERFVGRAQELWAALPQRRRFGATTAVSNVNGVDVVSLYANIGRGPRQFSEAQINRFRRIVEDAGGVFIHTSGRVHAEQALHQLYPTARAIGISNPNGPCPACQRYFQEQGYFNLFWPDRR